MAKTARTYAADDTSRAATIARIRAGLKARSGKAWSVTGGTGTAYGWLRITAAKSQRMWTREENGVDASGFPVYTQRRLTAEEVAKGYTGGMSEGCCIALARLLGLEKVHSDGVSVPASGAFYREYVDRAETGRAEEIAEQYWD
jgi:hypothetical protein